MRDLVKAQRFGDSAQGHYQKAADLLGNLPMLPETRKYAIRTNGAKNFVGAFEKKLTDKLAAEGRRQDRLKQQEVEKRQPKQQPAAARVVEMVKSRGKIENAPLEEMNSSVGEVGPRMAARNNSASFIPQAQEKKDQEQGEDVPSAQTPRPIFVTTDAKEDVGTLIHPRQAVPQDSARPTPMEFPPRTDADKEPQSPRTNANAAVTREDSRRAEPSRPLQQRPSSARPRPFTTKATHSPPLSPHRRPASATPSRAPLPKPENSPMVAPSTARTRTRKRRSRGSPASAPAPGARRREFEGSQRRPLHRKEQNEEAHELPPEPEGRNKDRKRPSSAAPDFAFGLSRRQSVQIRSSIRIQSMKARGPANLSPWVH